MASAPARGTNADPHATARARAAAQWSTQSASILESRGDPASLATAALLLKSFNPTSADAGQHAVALAQAATQAAPADPAIGWIRLRVCETTPGCDVPEAATSVRWLDAENAAAWLSTLEHAQRDRDSNATERALSGMAQGKRFHFYWNPGITLINDSVRTAALPARPGSSTAPYARLLDIVGWAAGLLPANLQSLFDACKETADFAARRDHCLKIAMVLQTADTVIAQLAGYSLLHRLSAPESKESRNALERRRVLEWRVAQSGKFDSAFLPWSRSRLAQHRFDLMRRFEREEDCIDAILSEHHIALDPGPVKAH